MLAYQRGGGQLTCSRLPKLSVSGGLSDVTLMLAGAAVKEAGAPKVIRL